MTGWGQGKGVCTGTVCRPEQEPHTGRTVVREGPVLSPLSPSQTTAAMLLHGTMPHTFHSSGHSLPVPSLCTPTVCAVMTRSLLSSFKHGLHYHRSPVSRLQQQSPTQGPSGQLLRWWRNGSHPSCIQGYHSRYKLLETPHMASAPSTKY